MFWFLKGPDGSVQTVYRQGIMKAYKLLLYNKWVEEEEENMTDGVPRIKIPSPSP